MRWALAVRAGIETCLLAVGLALASRLSGSESARPFRLGHFPNLTHAQAVYARAGGQFERKIGGPIAWTSFNAGPTAIEALFTDAIDATFVGPNPAINGYLRTRGERFVIIAGAASGGTGLVVRRDAGIRGEGDFGGKIIATPQLGNTQDVAARRWFGERGYRLRERGGNLTLLALSNPDQLTLFRKREIHGAWTVEPWLSRLELEGGGELFLDERTLWPGGRYVTTHLVVTRVFLADHPQLIRNLLAALVEVTQEINADKAAAGRVLNAELKQETGKALPETVVARALERIEFTWDPLSASLRQCCDAAHAVGFLRRKPDLAGIYSLRALNDVLRDKGLPPVAP
jgi:NitT/TauT family transport system substrate-binding protein